MFDTVQLFKIGLSLLSIYFLILLAWQFKLKKDKSDLKNKYDFKKNELKNRTEFLKSLQSELKNKKNIKNKKKKSKKFKKSKKTKKKK